ncbi:hypothetical protein WICMUC_000247 [Wickerhamomyces mucosus]|uniref:Alkyl transferase n=1 Tax=Wickerhamomyces mucosus TaxID=1378264 RepID=A0A9P8PYB8_9ASCO|nr:hypothetical protein WICMUC_000247 [Wickerhamomyces mucosus]
MGLYNLAINTLSNSKIGQYLYGKSNILITNILKTGYIPQHVAFIMDGNRRFAKTQNLKVSQGHEAGSKSLLKIIETCYDLEIKHVTIYAFSIENFNRSEDEVENIFKILLEKLSFLIENQDYEYSKFIQIKIIGNKSLIPIETLTKFELIEKKSFENSNTDNNPPPLVLNVCFVYTSRDEISHSIGETLQDVIDQNLSIDQINSQIISNNFYFDPNTPSVDLLIRTSGHTRLSDFLIWQVNESNSKIEFLNMYWPDFNQFDYYKLLLKLGFNKLIQDIKNPKSIWELISNKQPKLIEIFEHFLKFNNYNDFEKINNQDWNVDLKKLQPPPPLVSILGEKS